MIRNKMECPDCKEKIKCVYDEEFAYKFTCGCKKAPLTAKFGCSMPVNFVNDGWVTTIEPDKKQDNSCK